MSDDPRLQRWLAAHRAGAGTHPSQEHFDMPTLALHAEGKLPPAKARLVSEHLLACEDGRCGAFVRTHAASLGSTEAPVVSGPPGGRAGQPDHGSALPGRRGEPMRRRTFQARDVVWSALEALAQELGTPIDDLVNDAMADYARTRGYSLTQKQMRPPLPGAAAPYGGRGAAEPLIREMHPSAHDSLEETHDGALSALDRSYSPARAPDDDDDDLARTNNRPFGPSAGLPLDSEADIRTMPRGARPSGLVGAGPARGRAAPPMRAPAPPPARSPDPYGGAPPPPAPGRSVSSSRMPAATPHRGVAASKQLVLTYQGRAVPVDKDRFLLGRSKTQADLRLDDPNVSRQHAVIERVGAAWYVVDLGSTNGVHIGGERVARRALSDGDVIVITSHEIRCALR